LYYPAGVDAALLGRIAERGVSVAGGLHPALRAEYFRVGHMGYALTRTDMLMRTIEAIGGALAASGHAVDTEGAVRGMLESLQAGAVS
jgi:alanine-glyoxylate transaminase/serine-glyoxylate transaminase/serine-pyruvate transaminase